MLAPQSRCLLQRPPFPATQIGRTIARTCQRFLLTLAIETSCDDTSVAVLEKHPSRPARLHFHKKITADNSAHGGIHPAVALESHQKNLASLVADGLHALPSAGLETSRPDTGTLKIRAEDGQWLNKVRPDFVTVTRGPGMRSSLTTGLDTAKGLAVAWQVPLVGVNHMQAHALTPRLVSALKFACVEREPVPVFPFLSLLVSGGHTILVHSKSLWDHSILASTTDIAIGDAIDKMARCILPSHVLSGAEIMYGRVLERFAFQNAPAHYGYVAPRTRKEEITRKETQWGWSLPVPLAETRSGSKSKSMEFTFSGLGSAVKRICDARGTELGQNEQMELAKEAMRVAFEHLASRVGWALHTLVTEREEISSLVVSGGVASNEFLRAILRSFLDARGFTDVELVFPPIELCTDNAAMIAWTGMEMYENGWETDLRCNALRKWSIDPASEEGGILGVSCWRRRTPKEQ